MLKMQAKSPHGGITPLLRFAAGGILGLVGVFLTVRLKAFLLQAWALELPEWLLTLGVCALALLGFGFAGGLLAFLHRWSCFGLLPAVAICGAGAAAVYAGRGILLYRALEGSGVGMGAMARGLYYLGGGILLGLFCVLLLTALWRCLPGLGRFIRTLGRWDFIFLAGMLLAINALVWLYSSNSHTIYFWDTAGYWTTSHTMAQQWREKGFLALMKTAYDSVLTQDYNEIIALPAAAMTLLFGESRYVFLLAIANFGYFPLCVLTWAFAKRRGGHPIPAALGALLAVPTIFYEGLVGFVDVGGCIFTMLAMLLWDTDRGRNDFDRFLLVGLCLALGVLMRRWYAFYALAFVIALGVECLCFRRSAYPLLGTLAAFAFALGFPFQTLISERLLADYGSMYEAYALGLNKDFMLLFYHVGFLVLLVLLAVGIYFILRRSTRQAGVFLLLQPVLCFALFVQVQTHGEQHLMLYAPAMLCLFAMGFQELLALEKRRLSACGMLCALGLSLSPFLPREEVHSIEELTAAAPLPAFSWTPPVQTDADTLVVLMRRLDEFGEEGKTVALLASSLQLNRDILVNAEKSLSLDRVSDIDRSTYFRALPQVDQRDGWWDTLFYCDILVVADPIQLHLGEENQEVINLPARALLNGEGFGAAYEKLDECITLSGDIQVYFYQKVREPTEEEKEALRQAFFALHPDAKLNGNARS